MNRQDWQQHGIEVPYGATGEVRVTCPECSPTRHKTHDRCLAVNVDKGTWHCHHCGWTGGLRVDDDAYGSIPRPQAKTYQRPAYTPSASADAATMKARAWLERERAIPVAVSEAARIEARKVWMPDGDKGGEQWAIAFPYFRDGQTVNVKYRTTDKRFRMEKGAELCLYRLDDIAPASPLIWVEGEIDALSVVAAGLPSVVSVPNGAPPPDARNYERQMAYLDADAPTIQAVERHIIAVDNDAPGRKLRDELVRRLGPERCALVDWPDGCKDANDALRHHDTTTLRQVIEAARPVPVAGLLGVEDIAERIDRLYAEGLSGGEPPPSAALARHYTVKPGQWSVFTGIPGHGKSAVLDWLLVGLAEKAGWRFAVCSPENQPLERHAAQLIQIRARKPFGAGPRQRITPEELREAREWLASRFWFILPTDDDFTIDGVLRRARAAVLRHGVRGVVIDPWNEIEHQRPATMTETEYIGQALTKIRNFARRHEIHVWIVAHPTKLVKDRDGQYPIPTLYDISGTANWRNKADMGVVVWRDPTDESAPTQVHIQKVRFRECGEVGMVKLYFDKATGRYSDFGPIAHRDEVPPLDPWDSEESA